MVIDDPKKWDGPCIIITGGMKAVFKFIHKFGPIITSVHLYDQDVSFYWDIILNFKYP